MKRRGLIVPFAVFALVAAAAPGALAANRTLHGRVTGADGAPLADIDVALEWTADARALKPVAGVKTDKDGRFSLPLDVTGEAVAVVAFDETRARGAVASVETSALAKDVALALAPTVRVRGELSTEGGKYYPEGGGCRVALSAKDAAAIFVATDSGKFDLRLPRGRYVLLAGAPGCRPKSVDVALEDAKSEIAVDRIDLERHQGRVEAGDRAPSFRLKVSDPALSASFTERGVPGRWALLYFWRAT